jgi:hypothetical protein
MVKWYRLITGCEVLLIAIWPFFTFFCFERPAIPRVKGRKRGPREAGRGGAGGKEGEGPRFSPVIGKAAFFPGLFSVFYVF